MNLELNEDYNNESGRPPGIYNMRAGATVRISRNYNSYEASFSAECDATETTSDALSRWVRQQAYAQLTNIMAELDVDVKEKPKS